MINNKICFIAEPKAINYGSVLPLHCVVPQKQYSGGSESLLRSQTQIQ